MTVLLIVAAFLAGALIGGMVAVRLVPLAVARLTPDQQLAFARKIAHARRTHPAR